MQRVVIELTYRSSESQASPEPLQSALGPTRRPGRCVALGRPVPAVGRWVFSGARGSPTGHQSGACWLQSPRPSSLPCGLGGGHHGAGRIRARVAASPGCHFQGAGLPGPPPSGDARRQHVACGGRSFPAAAGELGEAVEGGRTGDGCFLGRRAGDTERRLDAGPVAAKKACAHLSLLWALRGSGDPAS